MQLLISMSKHALSSVVTVGSTLILTTTLVGCSSATPTALQAPGDDSDTVALQVDPEVGSITGISPNGAAGYQITLDLDNVPVQFQGTFLDAKARWQQVITGDLPDVDLSTEVPEAGIVDDLFIEASVIPIDGPGGILGQAGPQFIRTSSQLPVYGIMEFDVADVNDLVAEGQFDEVILHEMAHVIGFGTIWTNLFLLRGLFFPRFVGSEALAQYRSLCNPAAFWVPVENNGGPGTARGHWEEDIFVNELMTGFLSPNVPNPLSAITIGSLADLGYQVNLNAADPYSCSSIQGRNQKPRGVLPILELELIEVDPL